MGIKLKLAECICAVIEIEFKIVIAQMFWRYKEMSKYHEFNCSKDGKATNANPVKMQSI